MENYRCSELPRNLGEISTAILEAAALPPLLSNALAKPRERIGPPRLVDRECDVELPRRLFSAWAPSQGERAIVRSLTSHERAVLTARAVELEASLAPYHDTQVTAVEAELAGMFSGFRALRQQDEDAWAAVEITAKVLREFPLWAIAKACLLIAQGKAGLDPRWAPNDAQVHGVVAEQVAYFRARHASARALLAAPIEQPEPARLSREEIEAKLGRPLPPRVHLSTAMRSDPGSDGKHMQRVLADLAARKAAALQKGESCVGGTAGTSV
jgi:hypothetical protein